jgi:hypothetical protein
MSEIWMKLVGKKSKTIYKQDRSEGNFHTSKKIVQVAYRVRLH